MEGIAVHYGEVHYSEVHYGEVQLITRYQSATTIIDIHKTKKESFAVQCSWVLYVNVHQQ